MNQKRRYMEQLACLMEEEKHHLHRYACYKIGDTDEADDILQEMFLRLCSKSHLLAQVDNMRNYLYRTLANQCGMLLRERQKRPEVSVENLEQLQLEEFIPESFEQEYRLINRLLSEIPMEQSEVIRLHIHGGRTFADIAAILDAPLPTVKARYRYGIDKLRDGLHKHHLD